ncbi:hypothetical protein UlMin_029098 [Ulmus minor]
MMDLREKKSLAQVNEGKKCCVDCRTTKTPLWRGGPAGPKSLCNACGIRHRKKMISVVRLRKGTEKKRERTETHTTTATTTATTITSTPTSTDNNDFPSNQTESSGGGRDYSESLKVGLAIGKEFLSHGSASMVKKQRCKKWTKLGEEEQAAVLLMALSCDSVFA